MHKKRILKKIKTQTTCWENWGLRNPRKNTTGTFWILSGADSFVFYSIVNSERGNNNADDNLAADKHIHDKRFSLDGTKNILSKKKKNTRLWWITHKFIKNSPKEPDVLLWRYTSDTRFVRWEHWTVSEISRHSFVVRRLLFSSNVRCLIFLRRIMMSVVFANDLNFLGVIIFQTFFFRPKPIGIRHRE